MYAAKDKAKRKRIMVMGASAHTLFGFLQIALALALLLPVQAADQSGFISLACGTPEGTRFTDSSNVSYVSDAPYIKSGVSGSISATIGRAGPYPRHMKMLRSFPQGIRNCYNVSIVKGIKYLIRASFLYENYDGLNVPPVFDLYIGNSFWETVDFTDIHMEHFIDLIHITSSKDVHICLINTGNGVPIISSLEFRPLLNITYQTVSGSLSLDSRLDFGPKDYQEYRYPYDAYDRIWSSFNYNGDESVTTNLSVSNIEQNNYQVPSIVMKTASILKDISWTTRNLSQYYVFMHFSEVLELQPNQSRVFNITLNGNFFYGPLTPSYLTTLTVSNEDPLDATDELAFSLISTENATLPPIINALEIYYVKDVIELEANQEDVSAITNIKLSYGIKRDWQGNPCVPMEYPWSGLRCSNATDPRIISLNLSASGLRGEISSYIPNLTRLQTLDLSHNELTGELPEFLANMPNLRVLILTRNKLTGSVPEVLLQRAEAKSLALSVGENPDLCTSLKCDNMRKNNKRNSYFLLLIALPLSIIMVTLVIYKRRRQREQLKRSIQKRLLSSKNQQVRYSEILAITDNLKTAIGEGGFGKVYLGVLSDKIQVAIKLLSASSRQGSNEFKAEAQILAIVHHRNLVSLVGYCDEAENKALIYEFMANGNLRKNLSDSTTKVLSWMQRLQIALDAAQGLEYLHNCCKPPIIHRDLKTSNILLNEKMQAKISDFGLSRIFANENDTHLATCPAGTFGYVDPTIHLSGNFTKKSDVYSFGIVLFELITGQPVIISSSENNIHIVDWAKPLISEGRHESIVDERLEGRLESCSARKFMELALSCTHPTSTQRPEMGDVVKQLIECQEMAQNRPPAHTPLNNQHFSYTSIGSDSILSPR
ncbi:LRR receptor-like serine/threonine-protein kinase IOS1 isoform X2 [Cucurbita moschata]|uniref:non-specific serine/threonine protein kinase n=1 Tax=Cucurbita moschata TaxID=3662 RepID=A0A6J1HH28_CUCMO|nr:LRR receptor-like serine/threonine-protein kinase IOS1 isoform X2 [Cucurbita moschata]